MLKGIGSSEGYGIGKVLIVKEQSLVFAPKSDCDPETELERYRNAVDRFCNKTKQVAEHLKEAVGEKEAGIINSHILMIKDPYMNEEIEKLIYAGHCAESALTSVCHNFSKLFSSAKGIAYNKELKVGVMMETSASCLIADLLAKEADFFSIGTNDLTQYIMCADRGNADVAYLCSTYNPAVIRSIKHIIECGKKAGIPVGMCGEAASDKLMIPLLISFGLDEYSVNGLSVLNTRKIISQWTKIQADIVAKKVLEVDTEDDVVKILKAECK